MRKHQAKYLEAVAAALPSSDPGLLRYFQRPAVEPKFFSGVRLVGHVPGVYCQNISCQNISLSGDVLPTTTKQKEYHWLVAVVHLSEYQLIRTRAESLTQSG